MAFNGEEVARYTKNLYRVIDQIGWNESFKIMKKFKIVPFRNLVNCLTR